ncbi:hypothetical protein RHCRD62_60098 [Rhodococcus sp. RD6.2]|jgi:hypothetical protein|nr:hypothetical protein RHCRD62_60098 [Rhodococcus sp. RD6.2]
MQAFSADLAHQAWTSWLGMGNYFTTFLIALS